MIGNQIKKFRTEQSMTQKDLADKLFVTAQAVSRWENEEVEPSLETIKEMAAIFGVTTDEMLGLTPPAPAEPAPAPEPAPAQAPVFTPTPAPQVVVKKEVVYKEPKPVLAVCEKCNRPIYEGKEIVRHTYGGGRGSTPRQSVVCIECETKAKKAHEAAVKLKARKRRILSFVLGALGAAAVLGILLGVGMRGSAGMVVGAVVISLSIFTLISCILFSNNFIGEMFMSIAGFGIRMPGVIFTLDLDGIIWLLTVKLLGALLSLAITVGAFFVAVTLCGALSLFAYPFALAKNIHRPLESDFD